METIAVVVPAYNAEKYIKQCICSVKQQTFANWRMIIVDDGSTDSTYNTAKKYSGADDRISIIRQANQGSLSARKTGVNSETSQQCDYITFLDADDELYPDCLQILYEVIKKFQADIAVGNIRRMIKHNILWKHYDFSCMAINQPRYYSHEEVINELLYGYYGPVVFPVVLYGKLYKRKTITDAVNSSSTVHFMGEDLSVTIRAVTNSTIVITPKDVYKYRIGGGTSKFQPSMFDDFLALYRLKYEIGTQYKIPQDWKYTMIKELLAITKSCIQQCFYNNSTDTFVAEEVERICSSVEVQDAALSVLSREPNNTYAAMINKRSYNEIIRLNKDIAKKAAFRKTIKKLIVKF